MIPYKISEKQWIDLSKADLIGDAISTNYCNIYIGSDVYSLSKEKYNEIEKILETLAERAYGRIGGK